MAPRAKPFRFEPDTDGIYEASSGEAVRGILTQTARAAAAQVRKLAPSKRAFFDYRKSIKAQPAKKTPRGYEAAVVVDSPGWHLPEFGTSDIPPTAPLRRGMRLSGVDFKEGNG